MPRNAHRTVVAAEITDLPCLHERPAAATTSRTPGTGRFAAHPGTWVVPFFVIVALAAVLPAIYLGATVDPQQHLHHFPIAVVVAPQTIQVDDSPATALAAAIESSIDRNKFEVRELDDSGADSRMSDGTLYGAVDIPADFDASIAALAAAGTAAASADLTRPVVALVTNPRIGGLTTSLFTGNLTPVLSGVDKAFGAQLGRAAATAGATSTAASRLLLAEPFEFASTPYRPLPGGSGLGTSAFYYALLLVLLGFLGASSIHPTVDSALGFTPNEMGPLVSRRPYLRLSRRSTLLAKFAVMGAAAPAAAAVAMFVAGTVLGMPIDHPVTLWLFSTVTLAAVGLSALSVFAIFGAIGALVNMIFFVALAMTSSGGTVPLEATPAFFRWVSRFEPMHAILQGTKSILYFNATSVSGLTEAWLRVAVGGALGVVLGVGLTSRFDRSPRLARHPRGADLLPGSA